MRSIMRGVSLQRKNYIINKVSILRYQIIPREVGAIKLQIWLLQRWSSTYASTVIVSQVLLSKYGFTHCSRVTNQNRITEYTLLLLHIQSAKHCLVTTYQLVITIINPNNTLHDYFMTWQTSGLLQITGCGNFRHTSSSGLAMFYLNLVSPEWISAFSVIWKSHYTMPC